MELYVGNLPADASVLTLRRLFGDTGSGSRFRICRMRAPDGSPYCHGHVVIEPAVAARRLIDRLNGTRLGNRSVVVRRFVHRNPANERRAPFGRGKPWTGIERRSRERRSTRL